MVSPINLKNAKHLYQQLSDTDTWYEFNAHRVKTDILEQILDSRVCWPELETWCERLLSHPQVSFHQVDSLLPPAPPAHFHHRKRVKHTPVSPVSVETGEVQTVGSGETVAPPAPPLSVNTLSESIDSPVVDLVDDVPVKVKRTWTFRRLLPFLLVGVLIVGFGLSAGVGWYSYQASQRQALLAREARVKQCRVLSGQLGDVVESVRRQKVSARRLVATVSSDLVADPTVLAKLNSAVKSEVKEHSFECSVKRQQVEQVRRELAHVRKVSQRITTAMSQLTASRTLQSRNVLTAEVKVGQKLVKDSHGKVQEQKTLDQLNTVLTASNKLVKEKTADYTKLDKQLEELKMAEQSVRDSVEAKRKADEEAARKAEEENQQKQKQNNTAPSTPVVPRRVPSAPSRPSVPVAPPSSTVRDWSVPSQGCVEGCL
ncbi:hypothetical protein [Aeriscardovia aeriphila]|uniref:Molecular chaperone n=1 Tax=Aeriscardovia aeriphila TaxID=218139 RepID=A0A261FBV8_9BIFI|nr:hypothetical protein [Aeriscardovia aeriphila]NYI25321.1 hypothetical protein [Aeriscardovia aeriphila]OZG56525.1 hypothetical protein AEAE_1013 [Aeriscardovia aeriphila]